MTPKISAALIQRVASAALDQTIRLGILEVAAGHQPGTWSHRPGRLAALEEVLDHFPDIDPLWVTPRNTGMYDAVIAAARQVLQNRQEAEEIAQNVISGISLGGGGALAHIGRSLRNDIARGRSPAKATRTLARHTKQRALDRKRKYIRQEDQRRKTHPGLVSLTPGQVQEGVPHEAPARTSLNDVSEALTGGLRGPQARWILQELINFWKGPGRARESDVTIFEKWLEDPHRSRAEIARELGISDSYVSGAFKRLQKSAIEALASGGLRNLQRKIDLDEELGGLGYGGGARVGTDLGRAAKILAAWFETLGF